MSRIQPLGPKASISGIVKEGLLWKKARGRGVSSVFIKTWALRWFIFDGKVLKYYKYTFGSRESLHMDQSSPKGILEFGDETVVSENTESDKKCGFLVINCKSIETGTLETLYLAASSEYEKQEWIEVLSQFKSIGSRVSSIRSRRVSRASDRIRDLYDIHEEIGSGGFSVVKKGVDKLEGKVYALKMIQNEVFQQNQERAEEEVQVLAALDHPNIVKFKEVVRTQKYFVIVMEYLEGGELFDRLIERKKYSEKDAKVLAKQLLDALRYLHENDIMHRDIKPENLMFDHRGEDALVKLTDFGFATILQSNRKLTGACGTPEYVAPEILNDESYDCAVDLWSCGVVIYILLCGFPPFFGDDDTELFDKIVSGKFEFMRPYWDYVSDQAKDLISHLIEVNPKKRLTAIQALQHPWFDESEENGPKGDLISTLSELKRYTVFRKFRKAVVVILAANKLMELMRITYEP